MDRPTWRTYPYVLSPTDPELTFPAAEGDQGAESNTYYVAGRLRGRATRREWAFLVIFTFNNVRKRLRADFYTFALFDLAQRRLRHVLGVRPAAPAAHGAGATSCRSRAAVSTSRSTRRCGTSRWTTRRDADGALDAVRLRACSLVGRDARGRPHGARARARHATSRRCRSAAREYGGVKTCMGQYGTHSYFQSDVRFRGTLEWGDVREEVDGDSGWIDRQWTPRYLGVHSDRRNSGYRHEWRQIHLDNGVEMSVWLHVDRQRGNRPIPFCGVTAATPDLRVARDHRVRHRAARASCAIPGLVRPRYALSRGAKYFADRYRLRAPGLGARAVLGAARPGAGARAADRVLERPDARAGHAWPAGRCAASASTSARFAFARDFELVDVLRSTLRHLPDDAFAPGSPGGRRARRPGLGDRRVSQPRRAARTRAIICARVCGRSSNASPNRRAPTCCRSPRTCDCGSGDQMRGAPCPMEPVKTVDMCDV